MMFIGREDSLSSLQKLWQKKVASFVTCRGRRRIGKSTLIKEFARQSQARLLCLEGQAPGEHSDNHGQLVSFGQQLALQTGNKVKTPSYWLEAFEMLSEAIVPGERTVVLLDEISWMGGDDPLFAGTLKIAWDRYFHQHYPLIVVVCGSVSAWIAKNILHNTGFAGRISLDLLVGELPLHDCLAFWGNTASHVSVQEKLDVLSVTGGIPKYLEEFNPHVPANETIRDLCFSPHGVLFRDFNQIFHELFGLRANLRKAVLEGLSQSSLTLSQLSEKLGKTRNGHLSEILEELELSGFIAKDISLNLETGRWARCAHYRLKDNYVRFYLRYIEPHAHEIEQGLLTFNALENLPGWETILGLQFENLILNNLDTLRKLLNLQEVTLLSAAPYIKKANKSSPGCQIDLLIQSRHNAYVVEIKRQKNIGKEIINEMENKLSRLAPRPGMSIRTVLVYDGHLTSALAEEGYFDYLIPAEKLFSQA